MAIWHEVRCDINVSDECWDNSNRMSGYGGWKRRIVTDRARKMGWKIGREVDLCPACQKDTPMQTDQSPSREAVEKALDALKWANEKLHECGKHVDFTLGMVTTLAESEKREQEGRAILALLTPATPRPATGEASEPQEALVRQVAEAIDACGNDARAGWDWWQEEARAAIEAVARFERDHLTPATQPNADLAWFSGQHRLSLDHHSPVYGDDDDLSVEWRVTLESGSINDREFDVIGRGETAAEAIAAARTHLAEKSA